MRFSKRIGHLGKGAGWIVVVTQAALNFFETHNPFHLSTKAQRVHKLALRNCIDQNGDLRTALTAYFNRFDRDAIHNAIFGPGAIHDQKALTRTQSRAGEHLCGAGAAFFAHKGKAVARGGAVKGEHSTFAKGLERARECCLASVRDYVINTASGSGFACCNKTFAVLLPSAPLSGVIGDRGKCVGPLRIFSIHRCAPYGLYPRGALRIGDHADDTETTADRTPQAVIASPGGCAFYKEPFVWFDIQRVIKGAVDRAQRQPIGSGLLKTKAR